MSTTASGDDAPRPPCKVCGQPSSARCARCLGAFYCGGGCQRADWAAHKAPCKEAGKLKDSSGAKTDEDMDAWLVETKAEAESGDAVAQYDLGLSYKNGTGVAADLRAAFEWFRRAATAGIGQAMTKVGECYKNGIGIAADAAEAFSWYRRGAVAGDSQASSMLSNAFAWALARKSTDARLFYG